MTSLRYVILSFLLVLLMAGCASSPALNETPLGQNWGRSHVSQVYLQTANPDAVKNLDPVLGLAGDVAATNREEYIKSFAEKQQRTTYNIDLTGLGK